MQTNDVQHVAFYQTRPDVVALESDSSSGLSPVGLAAESQLARDVKQTRLGPEVLILFFLHPSPVTRHPSTRAATVDAVAGSVRTFGRTDDGQTSGTS